MKKKNVIAIGCFYLVEVSKATADAQSETEPVLIGTVFSKIERENSKNELLLETID